MRLTPALIPPILAMALIVVASNVLVQFLLWGGLLTWGAFSYPLAFLVTDVTNRRMGPEAARTVVLGGFVTGILCSLVGSQVILATGPAVPLRIGVASGAAFLCAQLLDVAVFQRLRGRTWWRAPLVSPLVSSVLDTTIFFGTAFSAALGALFPASANEAVAWALAPVPLVDVGPAAPLWASLAVADLGVKLAIALIALIPFRLITRHWAPQPA